jgi:hypothetical protein
MASASTLVMIESATAEDASLLPVIAIAMSRCTLPP